MADSQPAAHVPVLLSEVLDYLAPVPGGRYLDGTLGLGGHSGAILEACPTAELLGLDRDADALALATKRLAPLQGRFHARHARFSDFAAELDALGWDKLDGALVDVGVSSMQLDTAERGFSFQADGPLDMRMDQDGDLTAEDIVNRRTFEELKDILYRYGEEPQAGRIARRIVEERAISPITRTGQLAALVERAYPAKWRATSRNHPATRTFQALRVAVNGELDELEGFLSGIIDRLKPGGRVAVISFHSLEDRLVKHFFRHEATGCLCPRSISRCVCGHRPRVRVLTRKPVTAGEEEYAANPRARSAKLRVAQRLAAGEKP